MYFSWVLLVLIFASSLPVIAIYIWFRIAKFKFSIVWFLFALLAGAAAFFPALVFQDLLSFPVFSAARAALFYEFFIRIAFTEELSRLLILFIFFWIGSLFNPSEGLGRPLTLDIVNKGTATGLIAGLGFAILENARLAAAGIDINIAIIRIFTTALHGACGARIGAAAVMFPSNPIRAIMRVFAATAIHGVYNFMVVKTGLSSLAAYLIAITALITSILPIRGGFSTALAIDNAAEKE